MRRKEVRLRTELKVGYIGGHSQKTSGRFSAAVNSRIVTTLGGGMQDTVPCWMHISVGGSDSLRAPGVGRKFVGTKFFHENWKCSDRCIHSKRCVPKTSVSSASLLAVPIAVCGPRALKMIEKIRWFLDLSLVIRRIKRWFLVYT